MQRLFNPLRVAAAVFLALVFLVGTGAPSAAQTAPTAPLDVVNALAAAQNANDPAAMRALIAPDATIDQPAEVPGPHAQSRDEFIAGNTGSSNTHVTINKTQQTAPDTVVADATLSGGDLPALPHPFHLQVTFTVAGGLVTHAVIVLAPETRQDIAALGPAPGMPSTGASGDALLLGLAALGALCLLAGTCARRAQRPTAPLR
jgi:hypothetical protein